jgi:hypothetical protein
MYVKEWSLNHEKSISDFQFISLNLLMMKIRWNENGISQIIQDANKKSNPVKDISDVLKSVLNESVHLSILLNGSGLFCLFIFRIYAEKTD